MQLERKEGSKNDEIKKDYSDGYFIHMSFIYDLFSIQFV